MRVGVTGAGGFVGRRLVRMLLDEEPLGPLQSLTLADTRLPDLSGDERARKVEGDLVEAAVREQVVGEGLDVLFHLAAVPGGAAEADPALSRRVNLDASLSLFEAVATASRERASRPRVVYTSTIAVYGAALPRVVDDETPLKPELTYGAHKLMMEVALADLSRRGALSGMAVRLPGIVARPPAAAGMRSAFMSDVFHALRAQRAFTSPVSARAAMWMMSATCCAANLIHAASAPESLLPPRRAATLPALRLTMAELVAAIAEVVGVDAGLVSYAPDHELEAHFGAYPPLRTPTAEAAGFRHDGDAYTLVERALAGVGAGA